MRGWSHTQFSNNRNKSDIWENIWRNAAPILENQVIDESTTLVLNSNMWYLPYTGLLKQELESATINLYGINFPIESIGII